MTDTPHLGLPLIAASQSQKHVTHNQAIVVLDAIVMLSVIDSTHSTPPASPAEGDRYRVASGATGVWAGWDLNIALFTDGQWEKLVPKKGWSCYDENDETLTVWDGSKWSNFSYVTTAQVAGGSLVKLGILTAADDTNRLAVKSDAILFSHDDVTPGTGDLRVTLNKSAAGKDAGFVFQDGFRTRALFGLLGGDDFTVKVTPDGSTFHIGLVVDSATGQMKLPLAPKFSAYTNFDNYIAANAWTKVQFNNADTNDQNAFDPASSQFIAPFVGTYVLGFSLRFKANAAAPTKVIAAFYKNGVELGRGRAVSGPPVDDVTTWNLSVLTALAADDAIDVRVNFAGNDGYVRADQSHFWGHYVP